MSTGSSSSTWVQRLARVHRWFGVPLSLLVLVWFVSGIVMTLGGGFPEVTERQRLERSGHLVSSFDEMAAGGAVWVPDVTGAAAFPAGVVPKGSVRIVARMGQIIWEIEANRGIARYEVESGRALGPTSEAQARELAGAWLGSAPEWAVIQNTPDTWTPRAESHGWLPMLHAAAHDGTEVYVSLPAGHVVQSSTARARVLAWLGAIPHWLYVVPLRRHGALWRWSIVALSGVGACAALSGIVLGGVRAATHMIRHRQFGPFRKNVFVWHHGAGLTAGALVFTWLVSGALSLDPFSLEPYGSPRAGDRERARGGALEPRAFVRSVRDAVAACSPHLTVRSLELVQIVREPFYVCRESPVRAMMVSASHGGGALARVPPAWLAREVEALTAGAPSRVTELSAADAYYYPTHFEPDLPFPVMKVESGSIAHYVDLTTGRVLRRHDQTSRTYRWLYHGLHSLDLPALLARPLLWRVVVIALCSVGSIVGATGTWLAARRAWRTIGPAPLRAKTGRAISSTKKNMDHL
ncbi:hypothetical protein [Pendulispora albinea]|uniref:PepSY domain-containing protein n=1 Tax=Pendulispora albinea TaxID=2741071 RepID=A0ABZ2M600_9BACT